MNKIGIDAGLSKEFVVDALSEIRNTVRELDVDFNNDIKKKRKKVAMEERKSEVQGAHLSN